MSASAVFCLLAVLVLGTLAIEDTLSSVTQIEETETTTFKQHDLTVNFSSNNSAHMSDDLHVISPNYITKDLLEQVLYLRRDIHKHAELSGLEKETAARVFKLVSNFKPDEYLTNIGGHGMLFLFRLGQEKPGRRVILFRAEMDGLPIQESPHSRSNGDPNYLSIYEGQFHGCGHDGQTAIVAGMASVANSLRKKYENNTELNGDIIILFQPAEETGTGALSMIRDAKFNLFHGGIMSRVDAAFALHNLPGYERGQVLLKKGTFAAASKGIRIELRGETSHAAQPEMGRSPAGALSEIIRRLEELAEQGRRQELPQFHDFILLTIVYAHLGTAEPAYGVTPGEGRVMVTIRTYRDDDMATLVQEVESIVAQACIAKNLTHEITFSDEFHATRNEDEDTPDHISLVELVRLVANENGLSVQDMKEPFRWSEDFGNFQFKGSTFFGLGSGVDYPALHNDDYDFPDEITKAALSMFARLAEHLIFKNYSANG